MSEKPPQYEKNYEHVPTLEEVQSIFEKLIERQEYVEVRKLEDERGLYLWDILVSDKGGEAEYSYMRAGRYTEGQASTTAIHVTFFDSEGMPIGGHSVAKYTGGEWKLSQ